MVSQRDSEQKSVFCVWQRCDRAASGRLFGLSCPITLCSIKVPVLLRLFSNVNINTLDHLLLSLFPQRVTSASSLWST